MWWRAARRGSAVRVLPYGEDGAYVELEVGAAGERAARTHALAGALRAAFPGADVVAGAGVVAVFGASEDAVRAAVAAAARTIPPPAAASIHLIDVAYDGPDLDDIASQIGATRVQVIELHTDRDYTVELVGFLPGFAYLAGLDPRLVVPRRPSPRPRVAAHSVAVAGDFTGIYPLASPGGWNLLGRSLGPPPFDPSRAAPFLFAPGDRVRFRAATGASARSVAGASPVAAADVLAQNDLAPNNLAPNRIEASALATDPATPALVVTRPPGIATVQDAGRRGWLGRGMPPSGPLDPGLFQAANRAVGNLVAAAAIELLGGALELVARGRVAASIDGGSPRYLADGETLRLGEGEGAVRYLAVAGGLDVPEVIGARATLLAARIGGLDGRPLRRGDVLAVGRTTGATVGGTSGEEVRAIGGDAAPILLDPGPHLDRFPDGALEVLLATEWRASRLADRVGARLEGGRIPRRGPDLAAPVPMRRGAVQVTTDGTPIVLGPDHPTTGGYPVLAVVRAASFGALAQKRAGELVRFRLGPV